MSGEFENDDRSGFLRQRNCKYAKSSCGRGIREIFAGTWHAQ